MILFQAYPVAACLKYDNLFRHAAARDPLLRWDDFKDDLLLWCSTRRNFRPSVISRLGPPVQSQSGRQPLNSSSLKRSTHTTSGEEICKRFNNGNCTLGESCRYAHVCWQPNCGETHPAKVCLQRSTANTE